MWVWPRGLAKGIIDIILVLYYLNLVIPFFRDEVERLAKELQMRLYRTSVKEDLNVGGVFQHLAENYVAKVKAFNNSPDPFCDHLLQIGHNSMASRQAPLANNNRLPLLSYNSQNGSTGYHHANGRVKSHKNMHNMRNGRHLAVKNGQNGYYSAYGNGYSPQDYLNNPMFDSLHHQRRYWPNVERTITLKPLGQFAKSKPGQKIGRNACRVL